MTARRNRLQCGVSSTLDSSRWIKLAKGLDDFRFGPPSTSTRQILPASPAIRELLNAPLHSVSPITATRESSQSSIKRIHERIKQIEHAECIEEKLKEDSLILFPYLQSDIPHEVFEKLTSILDSAQDPGFTIPLAAIPSVSDAKSNEEKLKLIIDEAAVNESESTTDKLSNLKEKNDGKTVDYIASLVGMPRSPTVDPFRTFLKRINYGGKTKKGKKLKAYVKPLDELPCETDVRQVAEEFCKWMQNIGGEGSQFTMDVDKVLSSFAMDTELQSLVTTNNVLDEFSLTPEDETAKKLESTIATKPKLILSTSKANIDNTKKKKSKFIRYRYGAWYLDVKQWKKLKPGEILEDPIDKQKNPSTSFELDAQLGELHIYKAFTSFITRNNLNTPKFLMHVAPSSGNFCTLGDQEEPKKSNFHTNSISFNAYR